MLARWRVAAVSRRTTLLSVNTFRLSFYSLPFLLLANFEIPFLESLHRPGLQHETSPQPSWPYLGCNLLDAIWISYKSLRCLVLNPAHQHTQDYPFWGIITTMGCGLSSLTYHAARQSALFISKPLLSLFSELPDIGAAELSKPTCLSLSPCFGIFFFFNLHVRHAF